MPILVVPSRPDWAMQFRAVEARLQDALRDIPNVTIEHVGSTAVPGLVAKPVLDVDVIVERSAVSRAVGLLAAIGYASQGDVGMEDREALQAPDAHPARNVYVCVAGTLGVRNHLAVRDTLRARDDLRDRYAAVKIELAADPNMNIDRYILGKSEVLLQVLEAAGLSRDERRRIADDNVAAEAGGS